MFRKLPDVPSMNPTEADEARRNGARFVDVRERDEWDGGRIPGAEFRPMSTINDWYPELPDDVPVVVYCRSGSRSANVIHALMTQAGHTNLHNLSGGILAWARADLPVETNEAPPGFLSPRTDP